MSREMNLHVKPIFILGAAHSGTTILYRMLSLHPDTTWFSQFSQRGGEIPGRFSLPFYNHIDRVLRALFTHTWQKKEGKLSRWIVPRPGEANRIWGYILPENEPLSEQESIRRLHRIFEAECRFWRKSFIITKLPRLYRHICILKKAYPQAKFIHIVRDGRAVALSDRHKFMRRMDSDEEALKAAARYWLDVVNTVNSYLSHSEEDFYELRYENLCADVHGQIKRILDFVGLDSAKFPFHKIPETMGITNPKWLRHATDDELAILEKIQSKWLLKYGYNKR